jgi:hypothetical protein
MNNSPLANSLSVSVRIYRALLVAYPKKFREHYETPMVQVFRDSFRDAYHRNGTSGVLDLWLHTLADLLVTALIERITERSQHMFSPKIVMWGGVVSVFCGLLWMITGLEIDLSAITLVLALALGLGGLAGLYSRQSGQGRRLGLADFVLVILGTGLALAALGSGLASSRFNGGVDWTLGAPPVLMLSLGMVILGLGIVLLGAISLRGNALHHWQGLPLGLGLLNILGGMMFWLVFYLPMSQGHSPWGPFWLIGGSVMYPADLGLRGVTVLLGLAWMGLGIMLVTEANEQVAQPPPASA